MPEHARDTDQDNIPSRLRRLPELARNLWWTWSPEAQSLFRRLDHELWEATDHNPVRLLSKTGNLQGAAEDEEFAGAYDRVLEGFDAYLADDDRWFRRQTPGLNGPVAYFSMEFGLHESLPIYSGGLGVLAGDHVKSASDLGVPLVGVGVLYAQGYFRQRLDDDGRQEEVYEPFAPETRSIAPARDSDGEEVFVRVELPGREVRLKVWEVAVGRAPLLLLDAAVEGNSDEDRLLTARLYSGGDETRILQELILGVGGVRALRALGYSPTIYHMNEGHAAFLGLERLRELVDAGHPFGEARELVANSGVFTTHTPVSAGHDRFNPDLFWSVMGEWPARLGTDGGTLWHLGHKDEEWGATFNMTVLAFNLSRSYNGVSELHGEVTREMWSYLFPQSGKSTGGSDGTPITHITNGVHTWSWLAGELGDLFDEYAAEHGGEGWRAAVDRPESWSFIDDVPSARLWETHQALKERMLRFVEVRLREQRQRAGLPGLSPLDPEALTLGFARRFATYKRATLLLSDLERLKRITCDAERPVQFIFSGKAHPADEPGKQFIQALYRAGEDPDLAGRFIVLEDYDMNIARYLVQGVDVWLNNPRRPLEASGTSGQKASLNGAPNFSVLDGWWREAHDPANTNGWAIGDELQYTSPEEQDAADLDSLYRTLQEQLVPTYYDREEAPNGENDGRKGVPERWIPVMRAAIRSVAPVYSTQRMVRDYTEQLYLPRANHPRQDQM